MKQKFKVLPIIIVVLASILIIQFYKPYDSMENPLLFEKAKVLNVISEDLREDSVITGLYLGMQELEVEIISGKYKGEVYIVKNALSRLYNVNAKQNIELIVSLELNNDSINKVYIYNYNRSKIVYLLIGLFLLLLVVIGGINGFKSAVSLFFTGTLIIFFLLPYILKGGNPVLGAIATVSAATLVTFYLIGGWNRKTLAAISGTIAGVIIAGLISYASGRLAHLSGLTMEEAEQMIYIAADTYLNVRGLMFSSILIASLGAIMDVGMSISSSIFEINSVNPKLGARELYQSGMNVGRDIMGTMSNTLILAFAGGSLNIMLLITALKMPYYQLINLDLICTEIVQGIAGSIGIILTIPITALVSVFLAKKYKERVNSN